MQLFDLQDHHVEIEDPDQLHDFCVRLLRDAEPAEGPICQHHGDVAVFARALPRDLRHLLGVRVIDQLRFEEHDEVPIRNVDSWWARQDAYATVDPPPIVTTFEIYTPLAYPRSMVGVPFDSGAY